MSKKRATTVINLVDDDDNDDDVQSVASGKGCFPSSSSSSSDSELSSDSETEPIIGRRRKAKQVRKVSKIEDEVKVDGISKRDFSSSLVLKDDHENRPLWVTPDCVVYLERMSRFYFHAYEFLSTVGEPVSRSEHLHEWVLTKTSLHAASSVEMTPKGIIDELEKLSKVRVPEDVKGFIRQCADSYGKVKIVLHKGDIYVESLRVDLLRRLLDKSSIIRSARIPIPKKIRKQQRVNDGESANAMEEAAKDDYAQEHEAINLSDDEDLESDKDRPRHFQIRPDQLEEVIRAALELDLPLMDEFDYIFDVSTPRLQANLKHTTEIRPYQQKCLSKMFGNSRAKSGVFVLPCGAGKTLTAIAAVCTMQRSAMILCSGTVAVEQWKRQFHHFAEVPDGLVCRFTSKAKDEIKDEPEEGDGIRRKKGFVLITTYSMMLSKSRKSHHKKKKRDGEDEVDGVAEVSAAQKLLDKLLDREWGLLILDEVHVTPASSFRQIVNRVKAHCKLGLTATLVREDELIQDLSFLIGPKLYEANWMDLTEQGFLARVSCQEIRCPMTEEFMAEYLRAGDEKRFGQLQQLLIALNPNKFRACEYLMHYHEQNGDKVLIFCDNILAIEYYASVLKREFIHGQIPDKKRLQLLGQFQNSSAMNTLLISKVGDVAIDLPEANVIIQVSSHYGSRRQEAQRLGRILRAKPNSNPKNFNAHFYTLIAPDTEEQYYANRRQRYLVDQGYAFKVVDNILEMAESAGLKTSGALANLYDQKVLLAKLLISQEQKDTAGTGKTTLADSSLQVNADSQPAMPALPAARRVERATLASLSAAAGSTTYSEFDKRM